VNWFNPTETGSHSDPFPWYAKTREVGPIFFAPALDAYVASRYHEVLTVLKDPLSYSNVESLGPEMPCPAIPLAPEVAEEVDDGWHYGVRSALTTLDPPRHTTVRKLLAPSFTPRRIETYQQQVREIATKRIDDFAASGRTDLASEFAYRIPNIVIARILGMPDSVAEQFVKWTDAYLDLLTDPKSERAAGCWRTLVEELEYTQGYGLTATNEPALMSTTAVWYRMPWSV